MRLFIFVISCVFCMLSSVRAEQTVDQDTWNYVSSIPEYENRNISRLAFSLVKPYKNNYDKARAIAYYVASHISYGEYLYNNGKRINLRGQKRGAQDILKSKVGTGDDFSLLFNTMCQTVGVRTYTVQGDVFDVDQNLRPIKNRQSTRPHAWNYFEYQRHKIFVDTSFMGNGRTSYDTHNSNVPHRKGFDEAKKQNQIHDITPFYFDFDPDKEVQTYRLKRVAKHTR